MQINRRKFIATSLGACAGYTLFAGSNTSTVAEPRIACIGVGGRGKSDLKSIHGAKIVALCDIDSKPLAVASKMHADAKTYRDYRVMLTEMRDEIDAVVISTPDHTHFHATMMAMSMGKHVHVQKPLAHSISEVRQMMALAEETGVITQMGNQGHASEGIRLIREWYEADLIGEIQEVVAWTNRPNSGVGFRGERMEYPPADPVPANVDWNLWVGPVVDAPPYATGAYHPLYWRGWWKFGMGALGDIGCHTIDSPFWALDLEIPTRVDIEVDHVNEIYTPAGSVVKYTAYSKAAKKDVPLTWYEGPKMPPKPEMLGDTELSSAGGLMMIGSKGIIFHSGMRPNSPRLYPESLWQDFRKTPSIRPAKVYPRIKGSQMDEWIRAIKGEGPKPGSSFDYAGPLTETIALGTLAIRTGKTIEYDAKTMTITNNDEANALLQTEARAGFRVEDLSV
ncbi:MULTISPECIES: Gfo/Idh/MocA family protein [unclassified Lentimonas]|uniref:Gfo/Idh/MocA family protein n=1 Tax=unclassified Lentimonas TaxID=2630993 RepID=UPI001328075D|nr:MULTISPECIES: Gfo/Idh/MocA family oxidoreductase [unclassified Lentimonas]CAA6689534.1 Probable NADH-dependent dehydrogenase [Lentimonas sp. CC19]CAA6692533.1 Probable NADH-dependent dehydrogenase [Lentimonas sp. CC10]CAA7069172.1 Probable NADH-dependent dehydrogenase [Lentimonas sp. CC11]